jgi:hypothetical protein
MATAPDQRKPPEITSASDHLDRQLVKSAYSKVSRGETPTAQEKAALERFEKQKEERLRRQYYATIPQKHWREMSGRQTKVLNEQAAAYGIPFGGPVINLYEVARALHDFLAKYGPRMLRLEDDMMGSDVSSPALERYREERAALAKLDRLEREGALMPKDEARDALTRIASTIRDAGDILQRQYGAGALEILIEALDDAELEIERWFGNGVATDASGEHSQ